MKLIHKVVLLLSFLVELEFANDGLWKPEYTKNKLSERRRESQQPTQPIHGIDARILNSCLIGGGKYFHQGTTLASQFPLLPSDLITAEIHALQFRVIPVLNRLKWTHLNPF